MQFNQPDKIRYLTFDTLSERGVPHAVFTRQGGISPEPWASLNFGSTVGDDLERVGENRRHALESQGQSPENMYEVWQVHGCDIRFATEPRDRSQVHAQADGIFTDQPGLGLLMRFADCVPILLYDPIHKVVGIVHAGWQGTVNKLAKAAIRAMHEHYCSNPEDIISVIGPSIAFHHYEVGGDVIGRVKYAFGEEASAMLHATNNVSSGEKMLFDLWMANQLILENSGVKNIEITGICTACHPEDWYSHRGEGGRTGRFGVYIALPE